MPNDEDILEKLRSSIGLLALVYICRLYIKLSTFSSIILPSTARTHLIKQSLNDRYHTSHTTEDIMLVTNMIELNKDLINRVLLLSDFEQNTIRLDVNHITIDVLNDLILSPFTNICLICKKSLTSYRSKFVHIIDCFKIIRAVAVTAECKICTLIYNHSSWYSLKNRWRKINTSSLNSVHKVFYLCDSLAFTYSVFFDYTCQLLHNQCPFQSFSRILIDRYNYEHQNSNIILQPIPLAKLFQSHWLLYQIVHFEFMLGRTQIVNLPVSLNRNELNCHFECYSGWWYHLFTTFWSRHKSIPNVKCSSSDCSRCIIVDGHQKCRRLIGCPYTPCRRTHSSNSVDAIYCRYHQPSVLLSPSLSLQKAGDMAAEFSKRDRDFLSEHKFQCQNYRNDSEEIKKNKTYGILASYHPCGVAVGFTEAFKAEGMRSVTRHLLLMIIGGCLMPDALMYDCACALKLHWNKWLGTDMLKTSTITQHLPVHLALDNFHQMTHSRPMCQTIIKSDHPSHEGRFVGLNSQAAEQAFQYIARAKFALRNFSYPHSTVMLLIMLHLLNCKITGINSETIGLGFLYFNDIMKDFFATPCVYEHFGTLNDEEVNKDEDNDDQSDLDHNVTSEDVS
ncbi:unnamed protein product [Adineta ricciae]|uniref:Uncharacterized protein n=1 Tax=Adineta ricciae TaxID=249248 RepID=A0A815U8E9_ADIRI|nr:unnamed protein product [Adineta ricciae]